MDNLVTLMITPPTLLEEEVLWRIRRQAAKVRRAVVVQLGSVAHSLPGQSKPWLVFPLASPGSPGEETRFVNDHLDVIRSGLPLLPEEPSVIQLFLRHPDLPSWN